MAAVRFLQIIQATNGKRGPGANRRRCCRAAGTDRGRSVRSERVRARIRLKAGKAPLLSRQSAHLLRLPFAPRIIRSTRALRPFLVAAARDDRQPRIAGEVGIGRRALAEEEPGAATGLDETTVPAGVAQAGPKVRGPPWRSRPAHSATEPSGSRARIIIPPPSTPWRADDEPPVGRNRKGADGCIDRPEWPPLLDASSLIDRQHVHGSTGLFGGRSEVQGSRLGRRRAPRASPDLGRRTTNG